RHLEQNAAAAGIALSAVEVQAIGDALSPDKVVGRRYAEKELTLVNG
ncbi:aldo/keto reductase, partial [Mesorhizobium sp. M7A.F.Ca.US.003.02.2.1]